MPRADKRGAVSPAGGRLFHQFFVVGAGHSDQRLGRGSVVGRNRRWDVEPRVLFSFPERPRPGHHPIHREVCQFAFPDGLVVEALEATASGSRLHAALLGHDDFGRNGSSFVFTLRTGEGLDRPEAAGRDCLYAVCVRSEQVTFMQEASTGRSVQVLAPVCYCAVSAHPFLPLLHDLAARVMALHRLHRLETRSAEFEGAPPVGQAPECLALLASAFAAPVPRPGHGLVLPAGGSLPPLRFVRRENPRGLEGAGGGGGREGVAPVEVDDDDDTARMLADWCGPVAWGRSSPSTLVTLLSSLLLERKIVVVEENLAVLSSAVLSLVAVLRPLCFVGPVLPVVPSSLVGLLDAPVPCLMGVTRLPGDFECDARGDDRHEDDEQEQGIDPENEGPVIWCPSLDRIICPGKALLPRAASLAAELSSPLATLRQAWSDAGGPPFAGSEAASLAAQEVVRSCRSAVVELVSRAQSRSDQGIDFKVGLQRGRSVAVSARVPNSTRESDVKFVKAMSETQQFSHYVHVVATLSA